MKVDDDPAIRQEVLAEEIAIGKFSLGRCWGRCIK